MSSELRPSRAGCLQFLQPTPRVRRDPGDGSFRPAQQAALDAKAIGLLPGSIFVASDFRPACTPSGSSRDARLPCGRVGRESRSSDRTPAPAGNLLKGILDLKERMGVPLPDIQLKTNRPQRRRPGRRRLARNVTLFTSCPLTPGSASS